MSKLVVVCIECTTEFPLSEANSYLIGSLGGDASVVIECPNCYCGEEVEIN